MLIGAGPCQFYLRPVSCHAFLCRFLLLFLLQPTQGQQRREAARRLQTGVEAAESADALRVDIDLVPVKLTVTDASGRPVRNLRPEDFRLYEDGVERPVAFFNVEKRSAPLPIAVVFTLDISGSMTAEERSHLVEAMHTFSVKLAERPSVLAAVMTVGMSVKTLQNFTGDLRKLDHAGKRLAHEPNGLSTHIYDAVDEAIRMLERKAPRTREHQSVKRAVVVITDGFPVGDTVSARTVIERANAADVSVYTVTMPSYICLLVSGERTPLPTPLDVSGLAEKTGGTGVYANEKDFGSLFRALAEETTPAYVLAFYPPEEKRRDGRYHTIRIEAPPGLTVRQSRPGYQADDAKR